MREWSHHGLPAWKFGPFGGRKFIFDAQEILGVLNVYRNLWHFGVTLQVSRSKASLTTLGYYITSLSHQTFLNPWLFKLDLPTFLQCSKHPSTSQGNSFSAEGLPGAHRPVSLVLWFKILEPSLPHQFHMAEWALSLGSDSMLCSIKRHSQSDLLSSPELIVLPIDR